MYSEASDEIFEDGRKLFQGFYICFDAMKKSFLASCRKCIGLDRCFLKGVTKGYEVLDTGYRHIVDLSRQYCSFREWMLKGIPCPHAVAALHHKKLEPVNYISHWYNRETYMNTYSFFIQPVLNMKKWPQSQNISVMPPPVRKMPGRPGKNRKKEEGELATGTNANPGQSSSAGAYPSAGPSAVPSATPAG
ncbi:hypothetical protein FXO38_02266 [Capsicum annuum]|nr:hypothetical protein FXO38_02266 [Capsicum annuum]